MIGLKMSACHNLESPEQRTSPQGLSPSGGHVCVVGGGCLWGIALIAIINVDVGRPTLNMDGNCW